MSDEYEEHDCEVNPEVIGPPSYTLKRADLVGILFRTIGNGLNALSVGAHMLATEFNAAANHEREVDERLRFAVEAQMESDVLTRGRS